MHSGRVTQVGVLDVPHVRIHDRREVLGENTVQELQGLFTLAEAAEIELGAGEEVRLRLSRGIIHQIVEAITVDESPERVPAEPPRGDFADRLMDERECLVRLGCADVRAAHGNRLVVNGANAA